MQLNDKSLEVDTGSSDVTGIRGNLFGDLPLTKSTVQLHTYFGEALPVLGELKVKVQYQDQEAQLQLIVERGSGPSLFGQNWLSVIHLDWKAINAVEGAGLAHVFEKHRTFV